MFQITMGVPEMENYWTELKKKVREGNATKKEQQLFKKLGKAMNHLAHDPSYPGLKSHEITEPKRDRKSLKSFSLNTVLRCFFIGGRNGKRLRTLRNRVEDDSVSSRDNKRNS